MGGSFKKGSGSLDFGDDDEETESEPVEQPPEDTDAEPEQSSESATSEQSESSTYPYFVRRSGVTDERSNRLEVHVRDDIADGERTYLNELADELDTGSVAKTDAREFALKLAFENPEKVAELMKDEGYGTLD